MEATDQTGGKGPVKVSTNTREYSLFDELPKLIREEMANAPYDYSVEDIYWDYLRWKQSKWLFSPPDWEYLEIMRSNIRAFMHTQVPAEIYNPEYVLRRSHNVTRQRL